MQALFRKALFRQIHCRRPPPPPAVVHLPKRTTATSVAHESAHHRREPPPHPPDTCLPPSPHHTRLTPISTTGNVPIIGGFVNPRVRRRLPTTSDRRSHPPINANTSAAARVPCKSITAAPARPSVCCLPPPPPPSLTSHHCLSVYALPQPTRSPTQLPTTAPAPNNVIAG